MLAEECPDEWRFTVTDNGPGIAERDFQRVFGMFQTLQSRERGDSSGIGLAVVKALVERAGGRVWLDSTLGEGTRFHFAIPGRAGA